MILIDREMKAVAKTTNKSSYSSLCWDVAGEVVVKWRYTIGEV